MDQPQAPLVALTKFAIHLTARIEALEALLIQKKIATKQEIQNAIAQADKGFEIFRRSIPRPNEKGFDPALGDLLERLKARHKDQLG